MSIISEKSVDQLFQRINKRVGLISFLGKGEASIVLKVDTEHESYALKTALYAERREKVLSEAEIRNYFINKEIMCVPPPIYSDSEIFPNGAVIYEYVDGNKPDFHNINILNQLAQILSKIHAVEYKILSNGFGQIEKLYHSLKGTTNKIITTYPHLVNSYIKSALFSALNEYKQLISRKEEFFTIGINARLHGDLSNNFVIDKHKNIWLLDWENSEYGDIVNELCWFLYVNKISLENRSKFFKEYQKGFKPSRKIHFEEIYEIYFASIPVFNVCWGLDLLDMNIKQKLEPQRKLRDLAISAKNWSTFYSKSVNSLIVKGIHELTQALN